MKKLFLVSSIIFACAIFAVFFCSNSASALTTAIVDSTDNVGAYSSIALNSSGYANISYYDTTHGYLKFAQYNGQSWTAVVVDNTADVGKYSSMTYLSYQHTDYFHISYYDDTTDDLKYATCSTACTTDTNWSKGFVTGELLDQVGTHTSIAVTTTNLPRISYYNESDDTLEFAACDASCVGGAGQWTKMGDTVDSAYAVTPSFSTSLKLDSSNYPLISYTVSDNGMPVSYTNLKYAYCDSGAVATSCDDNISWHRVIVDNSAQTNVGEYNSMTYYSTFDHPRISYYDATNSLLKYAYCNTTCSLAGQWDRTYPDNTAGSGQYTSIQLTSNNLPMISYYVKVGLNPGYLKFAYCTDDASCTTNVLTSTVASGSNDLGTYSSLALGSSQGQTIPNISYFDATSSDLLWSKGSAPTNPSISINSGASYTNSLSATLTLSATGDAQMIVSEDSGFSGASWETSADTKAFTLSDSDGTKTVYANYRDEVFVEASAVNDTIILDRVAPTISATFPVASTTYNSSSWTTIAGTSTDTTSGVASTTLTIQRTSDSKYWDGLSAWEAFSTTLSTSGSATDWTFSLAAANLTDDSYTIVVTSTDNATNSDTSTVNFSYHNLGPVFSSISATPDPAQPGQTVTITFTSSETLASNPTVTVNGNSATYSSNSGNNYTYTYTVLSADGTGAKVISITGTDAYGNSGTSTGSVTFETTPSPTPTPTPFDEQIDLKDAILDTTYHSDESNTDLYFYNLPKAQVIEPLYIKLIRNKKKHLNSFTKKNSYPGYVRLLSNIGTVKKAYYNQVSKHIDFKVAIRYSTAKLAKTGVKEKNLRLYIKDRKGNWRGPYRIYQNKTNNVLKFKIRNYLIKPPKNPTPNPNDKPTKNRPFAPTFYFRTLKKINFVIADKDAVSTSTNFSSPDYFNFE